MMSANSSATCAQLNPGCPDGPRCGGRARLVRQAGRRAKGFRGARRGRTTGNTARGQGRGPAALLARRLDCKGGSCGGVGAWSGAHFSSPSSSSFFLQLFFCTAGGQPAAGGVCLPRLGGERRCGLGVAAEALPPVRQRLQHPGPNVGGPPARLQQPPAGRCPPPQRWPATSAGGPANGPCVQPKGPP